MFEEEWNGQERKGRFRIQEIKETKHTTYERTHHDSINTKSRFTLTTSEIKSNLNCPKIIIFTKDPKRKEWLMVDNLWQATNKEHHLKINRDSFDKIFSYIDYDLDCHNSEFDSKIKTNDDSEDKMNKIRENNNGRLVIQLKSNGFLLSPIQRVIRKELIISNENETMDKRQNNKPLQISSLHDDGIVFLSSKRKEPYNPFLLEKSTSLSFSIVKD